MTNSKKTSWILLYLAAFIPVGFSVYYFSERNLPAAFVSFSVSTLIYTLLVFKDLRILSWLSFLTMFLASLLMLGTAGGKPDGVFSGVSDEKAFMLLLSLIISFLLVNSLFWARTKQGLKKFISLACIFLLILIAAAFGAGLPEYHQNFIYTRVYVLILLALSVFLIVKKRKVLGILGALLSVGILFLGAGMFAEKTYIPGDEEQKEVAAFIDPMAKEMFGYYNGEDYDNFCKYCGISLKNMLAENPIKSTRDTLGPYIYFGQPSKAIWRGGFYRIEYPVKFQNAKNLTYLTFVMENISSGSNIYGFALSDESEIFIFWTKGDTAFIEEGGEFTFQNCLLKGSEGD